MRAVTKEFVGVAKKYNLLYDGTMNVPKKLNKLVNTWLGRTYVVTRHNVYVTDGKDGIFDIVNRIIERDKILKNTRTAQQMRKR